MRGRFPASGISMVIIVCGLLLSIPSAMALTCDGPPNYVGFNFASGSGPTGNAPYLLSLQGVAEPSPGGDPVTTWYWDFGDGTGVLQGSGTVYQNPKHVYMNAGAYTITYRAATSCNLWTADKTYPITVNPPTGGITINPVSNVHYGDTLLLSGTDSSGGTIVHLQTVGPSTPSGTKVADVPVQGGTWSYSWDTSTLPEAGTYTVYAFTQQFWQSESTSINLMGIVTPMFGKISVISVPSGSAVSLDGASQGITPVTLTSVSPGSHTVDLTLAGYKDYQTTVTVTAGQTAPLSVTLTPQPTTGGLTITSTPSGATIIVDGAQKGITPMGIELLLGSHALKLQKAGYVDYTATVVVVAGKVSPIMVQLVPLQQTTATLGGSLNIISIPENAAIGLDGIAQGTTPKSIQNVKAGSHTITLSYPGYNEWTGTVTVVAGGTMPITITLIAQKVMTLPGSPGTTILPSGTGSLIIQSTPTGANVYLDGEGRGMTPLTLSNVTPGTHRLLLTYSGYSDYKETVQLSAGAQHTVTAHMVAGQASPGFEATIALTAFFAVLVLWRSRR